MHRGQLLAGCVLLAALPALADEGFRPIFDGTSLEGWSAPDMSYWSVQDGAITAQSTSEHPCNENQFLTWSRGVAVDDFELKLKFRIEGTPAANSGIQFRSGVKPDGHVFGYQADIDLAGQFMGVLYDELGRGILAFRGQDVEVKPGHKVGPQQIKDAPLSKIDLHREGWNEYHIIAIGNKITLKINGQTTAQVTDNDPKERELSGLLALQLHSGPPMKVQFKDVELKRLPLSDGRRKVVFAAGGKSHAYGSHDHRAGCMLLADRLNASGLPIAAVVYYPQWPADPTAFDNANTIVFYCDGGEGHPANAHIEELDAKVKQGVGMVCIHYAVETTADSNGQAFLRWIGGYFEPHWSVNPFWVIKDMKLAEGHAITRGVKPFEINDEFYYHMRFREGLQGVTPIITALPPASTLVKPDGSLARPENAHNNNPHARAAVVERKEPQQIAWASENEGGGRGFGFTGGHVHWNWAHDDFRTLVLNAIAWSAGLEPPADGVPSKRPTVDEMLANHDEEPTISREQVEKLLRGIWGESAEVGDRR